MSEDRVTGGQDGGRRCSLCGEARPLTEFYMRGDGKTPQGECRACHAEKSRLYQARRREQQRADPAAHLARTQEEAAALRSAMFAAYGGRCACCGESVPLFLHIERVRLGEREPNDKNDVAQWRRLRAAGWPDTHELVCSNCSMGKFVHGACPHRTQSGPSGD
jgi:hypothetical protein